MANRNPALIVFPSELALRRYQQRVAMECGWVDASGHTTLARLRKLCQTYAAKAGLLVGSKRAPAQERLLQKRAVAEARTHFASDGPLAGMSDTALLDVLRKLISELASLPAQADAIIDWMMLRPPSQKLYQLGLLHKVWRKLLAVENAIDESDINDAQLRLLNGERAYWPPLLRSAERLEFRAVRWFNPFEELFVRALASQCNIVIGSALPPAHAEKVEDRLGQRIRSEIMADEPGWASWTEDVGDAWAVDSPDILQLDDASRLSFSRSAGDYGEIEDLARRICHEIETGMPPNRMLLIVPDVGAVQDIVPHVFGRFQIPYYFRRGRAVLSSPCVKSLLALLAFPLRPERDLLFDLIRNPAIRWPEWPDREAAVASLQKQKLPPRLDARSSALPDPVRQILSLAHLFGAQAAELIEQRIEVPEDEFNAEALRCVTGLLDSIGDQPLSLRERVELLEELLEESAVRPQKSYEQGVWILSPHDAVGLEFDLVLFSGLHDGGFPAVPRQDALFTDAERTQLRLHLEGQGEELPRLALPLADMLFEQQSVLFLSALGIAREKLVLSCQAVDQEGREKGAGEYIRKLWNLAGWPAQETLELNPYDQWRISRLPDHSIFHRHYQTQQAAPPEDRLPMPCESFLPIIPLPLCRARDEALQSAVSSVSPSFVPSQEGAQEGSVPYFSNYEITGLTPLVLTPLVTPPVHVVEMLRIENERNCWLEQPLEEREASVYCGQIESLQKRVEARFADNEFSPTALEALAQCRYVFLVERLLGLRDPQRADDSPDPMDRGGLLHEILYEIYRALAEGTAGINTPSVWAVKTESGWRKRGEGGADAIPLVCFDPTLEQAYFQFVGTQANAIIERFNASGKMLGHPAVWAAEREKILTMVWNYIRHDLETAATENRFPALFELAFGAGTDLGELTLGSGTEIIRLRGKIDRIDLVFSETGELAKIQVLDYKGSSRARTKTEDYLDEIRRNLDCQLPVYAFAAQQRFFESFNTPETNAKTEAGYHCYERDFSKISSALRKSIIPMDEPTLTDDFLSTLRENIHRSKAGDFAVDPLIKGFRDYQSLCRVEALSRDELE